MDNLTLTMRLHFDPLLPETFLIVLAVVSIALLGLAFFGRRRGVVLRALAVAAFFLCLFNPSLLHEERKPVSDVVVIAVDESPSQKFGERTQRTEKMLAYLQGELGGREDMEVRVVYNADPSPLARETRLFEKIDEILADVPQARRAGVIVLSDGQIHDVPQNPALTEQYGPVHLLLSGERDEKDRQIVITEAPAYGIVGQSVQVKYKVVDTGVESGAMASVTLNGFNKDGGQNFILREGEEQVVDLPIEHAGQNVFELAVNTLEGEITPVNNKTALIVNGVRDRLRVLLVSGQPYTGARTWRDMLKSDPGVDLVHFTILREPDKLDATPQNELSLIAFPVRELFEVKLYDFDLIVFDRYELNYILPNRYFENMEKYVREGGALLVAGGPDFASRNSLYETALGRILPGAPTGNIFHESFKPAVTQDGLRHPVTQGLGTHHNEAGEPQWGNWLRQAELQSANGDILMSGANGAPLLVLDRVDKGRVAQLASDHIWLWARGYEGGGPSMELLRRTVHWLMKEPELDEEALDISVEGSTIFVRSRRFRDTSVHVEMTKPDGSTEKVLMENKDGGNLFTSIEADQPGIYGFEDESGKRRFAVVGDVNPPELSAVVSSDEKMKPVVDATHGAILWMTDDAAPRVRMMGGARSYGGRGWIGLRQNNDYTVEGVRGAALLGPWSMAGLLLALMLCAWWREGRS